MRIDEQKLFSGLFYWLIATAETREKKSSGGVPLIHFMEVVLVQILSCSFSCQKEVFVTKQRADRRVKNFF
jgi:hypothetical protein